MILNPPFRKVLNTGRETDVRFVQLVTELPLAPFSFVSEGKERVVNCGLLIKLTVPAVASADTFTDESAVLLETYKAGVVANWAKLTDISTGFSWILKP